MRDYTYCAYHLTVDSEIPFPQLPPSAGRPEVVIRRASLKPPMSADEAHRQGVRTNPMEANLFVPEYGAVSIRAGTEILVDPLASASEQAIHILVLEYAMAVLLHQRGLVVLHASAVHDGRSASVFVGDHGWGKSTMAAALHERGLHVAADDISAIEVSDSHPPRLWPAFPQLKLWPESLVSLAKDPLSLPSVLPDMDKRLHRVDGDHFREPLPVGRIYVLGRAETRMMERLDPQQAFANLLRHQYSTLAELIKHCGQSADNVSRIARLVEEVPVFRLVRPPSLERIGDLAEWVKGHIEDSIRASCGNTPP